MESRGTEDCGGGGGKKEVVRAVLFSSFKVAVVTDPSGCLTLSDEMHDGPLSDDSLLRYLLAIQISLQFMFSSQLSQCSCLVRLIASEYWLHSIWCSS